MSAPEGLAGGSTSNENQAPHGVEGLESSKASDDRLHGRPDRVNDVNGKATGWSVPRGCDGRVGDWLAGSRGELDHLSPANAPFPALPLSRVGKGGTIAALRPPASVWSPETCRWHLARGGVGASDCPTTGRHHLPHRNEGSDPPQPFTTGRPMDAARAGAPWAGVARVTHDRLEVLAAGLVELSQDLELL